MDKQEALKEAIAYRDLGRAETLLVSGADANLVSWGDDEDPEEAVSPFDFAMSVCESHRDDRFLRLLARYGADPNTGTDTEPTLLFRAVDRPGFHHNTAICTLVELGADLYAVNAEGDTAFDVALKVADGFAAVALVDAGFNAERSHRYNENEQARLWFWQSAQADYAAYFGEYLRLNRALDDGAPFSGTRATTLLITASEHGHADLVRLLVERGADVEETDKYGSTTPLIAAAQAYGGWPRVVRVLLEAGADVHRRLRSGLTAMTAAAHAGNVDVLQLIISAGGDVEEKGGAPLSAAVCGGNPATVRFLMAAGADALHRPNGSSSILLLQAICSGSVEVVPLLLAAGLDPSAMDKAGYTALYYAARHSDVAVVRSLIAAGADVNGTAGPDNETPLFAAVRRGSVEMVRFLLQQGANHRHLDAQGMDCLANAWHPNKPELLTLIEAVSEQTA